VGKSVRPIHTIVVHHSASNVDAHTWQNMRQWHKAKGWRDIGYHYGIIRDGPVGWEEVAGRPVEEEGAHAKGFNYGTVGVCVEGNYSQDHLSREAYRILLRCVWRLAKRFNIGPSFVVGHRELPYATECPGLLFPLERLRGDLKDMMRIANLGKVLEADW
jgi:N-acetylmuramoyl-L-alanine amidase